MPIPPALSKYCHCLWNAVSADIPLDEFVKLDSGEVATKDNATLNRRGTQHCRKKRERTEQVKLCTAMITFA